MKDTDNTDRAKLLSAAFTDVEPIVGNHAMRALSLATYDVLLRTGNPLVERNVPQEGTPEFTGAMMGFVYTHCAPWPEVVRASFDEQAFREAALIFCGDLTSADFAAAFRALESQSKQLEAAQVEGLGGGGRAKKRLPATNRGS